MSYLVSILMSIIISALLFFLIYKLLIQNNRIEEMSEAPFKKVDIKKKKTFFGKEINRGKELEQIDEVDDESSVTASNIHKGSSFDLKDSIFKGMNFRRKISKIEEPKPLNAPSIEEPLIVAEDDENKEGEIKNFSDYEIKVEESKKENKKKIKNDKEIKEKNFSENKIEPKESKKEEKDKNKKDKDNKDEKKDELEEIQKRIKTKILESKKLIKEKFKEKNEPEETVSGVNNNNFINANNFFRKINIEKKNNEDVKNGNNENKFIRKRISKKEIVKNKK